MWSVLLIHHIQKQLYFKLYPYLNEVLVGNTAAHACDEDVVLIVNMESHKFSQFILSACNIYKIQ